MRIHKVCWETTSREVKKRRDNGFHQPILRDKGRAFASRYSLEEVRDTSNRVLRRPTHDMARSPGRARITAVALLFLQEDNGQDEGTESTLKLQKRQSLTLS